jgi:DNA phosphorothioation system restriction enzyme
VLPDLNLKRRYRSNDDDLAADFYVPCLSQSNSYLRAVGYYSSAALAAAAAGLPDFIRAGGRMKLVASPQLSAFDLASIVDGYEQRGESVGRSLTSELESEFPNPVDERLGLLGWMIAHGQLDIKLAVMKRADGTAGIYHEKMGVFEDAEGNAVAFLGSANESKGGLHSNFESVLAFRSWVESDLEDVDAIRADFQALWENRTPNLGVFAFPAAAEQALVRRAGTDPPVPSDEETRAKETITRAEASGGGQPPQLPPGLELRSYQQDALVRWLRNDGRGILEMATGTGKTYTALAGMTRLQHHLAGSDKPLLCVIVCPYQHLVRQWSDAVRQFGLDPVLCYQSVHHWRERLNERVHAVRTGTAQCAVAIATTNTFSGESFSRVAAEFPTHTLLVADEAHNLGATKSRDALTDSYRYRLALSATPERAYDQEGTELIDRYFGGTVFSFGLAEAIESGALTPYDYFPHLVYLEDDELDRYLDLTAKIARLAYANGDEQVEGPLLTLMVQRARILASARGKLSALAESVRPFVGSTHNLFYCGDGTIDDGEAAAERQLDAVVRMLGSGLGMRVQSYTHENFADERDLLRERFASGDLEGLVAIRCLDEGVDIPETRRAFILASSTNPRQFVQRRGRVLRRAAGKEAAEIHDFLVLPPQGSVAPELWQTERKLVEREIERIALFARLARNGAQALHSLADVRERYGLLHIG